LTDVVNGFNALTKDLQSKMRMNNSIGPIELLTIKTNNRLLKTKHHVSNNQVRATLEELSHLLDAAVDSKDVDSLDAYSIINCIRLMARTPSDVFQSQS
jgi:hypothetical protein